MKNIFTIILLSSGFSCFAEDLVIHAGEIGIGKFHRQDNKVHAYLDDNVWKPYVLSEGAGEETPVVVSNPDRSVTIFYSTLEELFQTLVRVAAEKNQKIGVLNINIHGMPGGVWVPKDKDQKNSFECWGWIMTSEGSDLDNYEGYYSATSKQDIMELRNIANAPPQHYECTAGLSEWKEIAARVPNLKKAFSNHAQVHFLSCLVGLGTIGDAFTKGIAALLLQGEGSRIHAALQLGLGDHSISEGMGFWDYIDDDQLAHDNEVYVSNKNDRDIMQKGTIRVAALEANGIVSGLIKNIDFMFLNQDDRPYEVETSQLTKPLKQNFPVVSKVRIPGTRVTAKLIR